MSTNPSKSKTDWYHGSFALRTGIVLVAEVAFLSFLASAIVLIVALRRLWVKYQRSRWASQDTASDASSYTPPERLVQPIQVLFLVAILGELLQSFATVLAVRWPFHGEVIEDSYCHAQAALKQIGNDTVALSTTFIAVFTFVRLKWPRSWFCTLKTAWAMIVFLVIFLFCMILVPALVTRHTLGVSYYGQSGPWCWVVNTTATDKNMEILSEYMWMWVAAASSCVCYGYVAFHLWRQAQSGGNGPDRQDLNEAWGSAWFPIAYIIEIAPQSVIRLLSLQKSTAPHHGWTILSSTLFAASGLIMAFWWWYFGRDFGISMPAARGRDHEETREARRDSNSYRLTPKPSRSFEGSTDAQLYVAQLGGQGQQQQQQQQQQRQEGRNASHNFYRTEDGRLAPPSSQRQQQHQQHPSLYDPYRPVDEQGGPTTRQHFTVASFPDSARNDTYQTYQESGQSPVSPVSYTNQQAFGEDRGRSTRNGPATAYM